MSQVPLVTGLCRHSSFTLSNMEFFVYGAIAKTEPCTFHAYRSSKVECYVLRVHTSLTMGLFFNKVITITIPYALRRHTSLTMGFVLNEMMAIKGSCALRPYRSLMLLIMRSCIYEAVHITRLYILRSHTCLK